MNTTFNETHYEPLLWPLLENLTDFVMSSCCLYGNDSLQEPFWLSRGNMTAHLSALKTIGVKLNHLVIPIICIFGVIGNSFSIYVFSRRWLTKYMDQLERSATAGLISLSLSDCSFCLVSLPALFLRPPSYPTKNTVWNIMALYYNNYRAPVTNLFLLNSTWIIVLISLERFIAVSYAIKARWMIRVRVTIFIHVTVFLASVLICLPLLLRNRIKWVPCQDNLVCVYTETWPPLANQHIRAAYRIVWVTLGTFIPLFLLVVSSVRLLVDLYRSKAFGFADPDRYCTPQITTMIASILLSFIALVCPSMILECVGWFAMSQRGGRHSREGDYGFWMAILITNLLQAIKFASNFLLYCAVSREFRKNFNFRRLRESFTMSARQENRQATLQRAADGSSASACQLIALHSQSTTPSQDGKEFVDGKYETSH